MDDVARTFSSVLELMKERYLWAQQSYIYGDITFGATDLMTKEDAQHQVQQVQEQMMKGITDEQ